MRCQLRHPHQREMSTTHKIRAAKPFALVAVCFMAAATSALTLAQSSPKDDAGRIMALEQAWNRAIEAKDTQALDQLLAPTFVAVDTDGGLTNKGEFLASIKGSFLPAGRSGLRGYPSRNLRRHHRHYRRVSHPGNSKRKTYHSTSAFRRHLDQKGTDLAMRCQPGRPHPRQTSALNLIFVVARHAAP